MAVFNKTSLAQINVDSSKCNDCGTCESVCPMNIEVRKSKKSLECIKCGECVDNCPQGAIGFKLLPDIRPGKKSEEADTAAPER